MFYHKMFCGVIQYRRKGKRNTVKGNKITVTHSAFSKSHFMTNVISKSTSEPSLGNVDKDRNVLTRFQHNFDTLKTVYTKKGSVTVIPGYKTTLAIQNHKLVV